ncbi:MAG: histidine kinase [Gammaproteobacteria bacterium]|jgi:two-component system sensor histidine kinase AlgZ|nr:histidine kinase [Gammaproteobacteria bacterium]
MKAATGQGTREAQQRDFFIPDLCAPYSVLVMILLAEVLVLVHVLLRSGLPAVNWQLLAVGSFSVQFVVLLSAALLCQLRKPLSVLSLPMATLSCLMVVALVTIGSTFFFQYMAIPAQEPVSSWQLLRNTLVACVVACVVLRYFYLQQQLRLREQQELQSRLDSLRDRIRPHFLFNTLNSIASLIESRPEAAEKAVEDLAELFRASLQEERGATTVDDELRLCELYLGIEQLRLGERLTVSWQVDDAVRELPMPSLLLQPLVENAIYHGVSRIPEGGTVQLVISTTGNRLVARVENPVHAQAASSSGHQIALANIKARMAALYGEEGELQITPGEHSFCAMLSYPLEAAR